jgi:hypothetical protein
VIHEKDFFGGPYVPEFIFHRYGPLKLATWSSLFLECACIFLVWSSNRTVKYFTVYSMIALHIGIELTMNMHVFEWLSIIGWCMFFVEPNVSYQEYCSNSKYESSSVKTATKKRQYDNFYHHQWFISIFLLSIIVMFIIDTIPLLELVHLVNHAILPYFSTWATTATVVITNIQSSILSLYNMRLEFFVMPFMQPYLYPIGIFQGVWNLYSGAPDTNCRFTTSITTYTNSSNDRTSYTYISPDWGNMTWYEKKRYQRPMTMQEKLVDYMCRDCYISYQANNVIKDILRKKNDTNDNLRLASAVLSMQCEYPSEPPTDDWFNWSGWFYADAKQTILVQREHVTLYTMNLCNDMNVELCQQWYNEGLCNTADYNPIYRHSLKNGTILTDRDAFVYNITQTCRQSCSYCPEHGYHTNNFSVGTRLSIFWPLPTWDNEMQYYTYDANAMYYDGTIIEVQDSPMKQYLIKYDDSFYNNEWFDPMILRDRGYRFAMDENNDYTANIPNTTQTSTRATIKDVEIGYDDNDHNNSDDDDVNDSENDQDEL